MAYNIPEILESRKVTDVLFVLVLVLLGVSSFGLGRLSALENQQSTVAVCPSQSLTSKAAAHQAQAPTTQGQYVASKNGSVYHYPWCSGAQRIKEENKVWFTTKNAAEGAGYRPAANCKGL